MTKETPKKEQKLNKKGEVSPKKKNKNRDSENNKTRFKRRTNGFKRTWKRQKALKELFHEPPSHGLSLPNPSQLINDKTFIVKRPLFIYNQSVESSSQKDLKGLVKDHELKKDAQKVSERRRRGSRSEEMVSRNAEAFSRVRTKGGIPENKTPRRKPHSLPPLPRTPKSPNQKTETHEAQNLRRLIGSPPPSGLLKRGSAGSLDIVNIPNELLWRSDSARSGTPFPEGEHTVYSPNSFLESSQPKITLKMAPKTDISEEDEPPSEPMVVRTASSTRSLDSISSLVRSASSLNLNSSLSLPPRLLSYQAENGSTAVQEWVPEDRLKSAPFRRSSTPSIRDLPTPLQGVSPLEVTPKSHPNSKNSKRKLKPLKK